VTVTDLYAQALLEHHVVTAEAVEEALQNQVVQGGSLDTNLLEKGVAAEADLLRMLGDVFSLPTAGRNDIDAIPPHVPRLFPLVFAETYHLVPYRLVGQNLGVLVNRPGGSVPIERIEERLQLNVKPTLTTEVRLHYAMYRLYGTELRPRFRDLLVALDGDEVLTKAGNPSSPTSHMLTWGLPAGRVEPPRSEGQRRQPIRVAGLLGRLAAANDRDTIISILMEVVLSTFEFAAIFLVQGDRVNGWRGANPTETERVARISLPIQLPSVFQTIYATNGHYLGPLPANSVNTGLVEDLGRSPPRTAFLAPILVGGKLAAIIFADNGSRGVPSKRVSTLLLLCHRAGQCLEGLIHRRKALGVPPPPQLAGAEKLTTDNQEAPTQVAHGYYEPVVDPPQVFSDETSMHSEVAATPPLPPVETKPANGTDEAAEGGELVDELAEEMQPAVQIGEGAPAAPQMEENAGIGDEPIAPLQWGVTTGVETAPRIGESTRAEDAAGAAPQWGESADAGAAPAAAPSAVARLGETAAIDPTERVQLIEPPPLEPVVSHDEVEAKDPWQSVQLDNLDTSGVRGDFSEDASPEAATAAFARGVASVSPEPLPVSAPEPPIEKPYVAFADVDEAPGESVGEWEDVFVETLAGDRVDREAEEAPSSRAPPAVTWEDVIAEAENAPRLTAPAPSGPIEVAGTVVDEKEILLDSLQASEPEAWKTAVDKLSLLGSSLDDELKAAFPGAIRLDPFAPGVKLPPFSQCSGLTALLAARGAGAASVVLPFLESNEKSERFFAIYFLYAVPYPAALELLARRLYDAEPRNRFLAADALRTYRQEPGYRRIIQGLRDHLKVPVLEAQVATVQVLGQLRDPSAVPSLIPLVVSPRKALARASTSALTVICGQSFGAEVAHWAEWWQSHFNKPREAWLVEGMRHPDANIRRIAAREFQLLTGRTAPTDSGVTPETLEQRTQG
jgi:hypothetical protein